MEYENTDSMKVKQDLNSAYGTTVQKMLPQYRVCNDMTFSSYQCEDGDCEDGIFCINGAIHELSNDYELETLLFMVSEECGEMVQQCSHLMRQKPNTSILDGIADLLINLNALMYKLNIDHDSVYSTMYWVMKRYQERKANNENI